MIDFYYFIYSMLALRHTNKKLSNYSYQAFYYEIILFFLEMKEVQLEIWISELCAKLKL